MSRSIKQQILSMLPKNYYPQQGNRLQVVKRNGQCVSYDANKIHVAILSAFTAVEGENAIVSHRINEQIQKITRHITQELEAETLLDEKIHIEKIQDKVEFHLMELEPRQRAVAKSYLLFREERNKVRNQRNTHAKDIPHLQVIDTYGQSQPLDPQTLKYTIMQHCKDLLAVDAQLVFKHTWNNLYNGMPAKEINTALIIASRALVERDPDYNTLTARFLIESLYKKAHDFLNLPTASSILVPVDYLTYFSRYIQKGIELKLLDPRLQTFDLTLLSQALQPKRDMMFSYLSIQTLYDRYLLHFQETQFELPQAFFMRVAMGLSLEEKDKDARAIQYYETFSTFRCMPSTPTLFNAGTSKPQLSSCFLTTIPDNLEGIYNGYTHNALLSKFSGGLGNDWTPVRASGSRIRGTNGKSQGVVPFLNVANASTVAVNQGGKRKGATCSYLETWHLDIEAYLDLRKNTGDDRLRTHDMNTAHWIPDLFMKRVFENKTWTLFSPDDVPDLHDLYGIAFEKRYAIYEAQALKGEINLFKQVSATGLWRKMLSALFETGHPWITYKDPCNLRSPQQHQGVVHSSNLCTEITLNTSAEEIAVCNLASINLAQHLTQTNDFDTEKLKETVTIAMRLLDNVIDINYYTVPQAKTANLKHRPVGLGVMGFQDVLFKKKMAFKDPDTVKLADYSMELVSYFAIEASCELAKERGTYHSFQGSLWSQGILPIDSIKLLKKARGQYLEQDDSTTLDWKTLREKVVTQGMRNSNCLAIAPTATISNICHVTPSIEPIYQNLFVKSNMSGEFTVINSYLVEDLKALHLWDKAMVNDLKYYDGSIQKIERIPESLKAIYATAFEIEPTFLIQAASRRQKWLDQSQSLNLFMREPSGKKISDVYKEGFLKGLKTNYYLRVQGLSHVEKTTTTKGTLNAVSPDLIANAQEKSSTCHPEDLTCEVCQ